MLYHVTEMSAVPAIMREGIVPAVGPRSARLGEAAPAVYLFASLESVEDALGGWLGESFDEEAELAVIEVDLPGAPSPGSFEVVLGTVVPAQCLTGVLDESLRRTDWPALPAP